MVDLLWRLPRHERRLLEALDGADVEELARRRLAGEPLQYLEGTAPFTDFDVVVDERVLIPRPETEGLFEWAARAVHNPGVIVDLGTGTGVLAVAFARRFPPAEVHAADLSTDALEVAETNIRRLEVAVSLWHGDLFEALPQHILGKVDLVVSNPPYVAEGEWCDLPSDVRWEPREALVAGPRGTEVLERIAAEAGDWLAPGGVVACEIGETQTDELTPMFAVVGDVTSGRDLAGRPRYLGARRRG